MFKDELLQDIKGLSGVPIFISIIVVSFLIGESTLSIQLLVGLILAYIITVLIRAVYFEKRPDNQPFKNFIERIDASSFPSLHAMRAAVLATLFASYFGGTLLAVFLALCAIAVAIARVLMKRHFMKDVIAGLILGVLVAFASVWFVARFIS